MPPLNTDNHVDSMHLMTAASEIADDSQSSTHSTIPTLTEDADGKSKPYKAPDRVSFGNVEIRDYERILGDHPDTRVGPPISIGWNFVEREAVPVDQYEEDRASTRRRNLRLTSITRRNLLINVFEVPEEDIRQAEKEIQKISKGRQSTNKQSKTTAKVQEASQSARRKLRRMFSGERLLRSMSEASKLMMPVPTY